jgi:hypothetical protein
VIAVSTAPIVLEGALVGVVLPGRFDDADAAFLRPRLRLSPEGWAAPSAARLRVARGSSGRRGAVKSQDVV